MAEESRLQQLPMELLDMVLAFAYTDNYLADRDRLQLLAINPAIPSRMRAAVRTFLQERPIVTGIRGVMQCIAELDQGIVSASKLKEIYLLGTSDEYLSRNYYWKVKDFFRAATLLKSLTISVDFMAVFPPIEPGLPETQLVTSLTSLEVFIEHDCQAFSRPPVNHCWICPVQKLGTLLYWARNINSLRIKNAHLYFERHELDEIDPDNDPMKGLLPRLTSLHLDRCNITTKLPFARVFTAVGPSLTSFRFTSPKGFQKCLMVRDIGGLDQLTYKFVEEELYNKCKDTLKELELTHAITPDSGRQFLRHSRLADFEALEHLTLDARLISNPANALSICEHIPPSLKSLTLVNHDGAYGEDLKHLILTVKTANNPRLRFPHLTTIRVKGDLSDTEAQEITTEYSISGEKTLTVVSMTRIL